MVCSIKRCSEISHFSGENGEVDCRFSFLGIFFICCDAAIPIETLVYQREKRTVITTSKAEEV